MKNKPFHIEKREKDEKGKFAPWRFFKSYKKEKQRDQAFDDLVNIKPDFIDYRKVDK